MDQFAASPGIAGESQVAVSRRAHRPARHVGISDRLRLLLQQNELIVEELALPSLHRQIAEAARRLVPARATALAVADADGAVHQLLQQDEDDEGAVSVLLTEPALAQLTATVTAAPLGEVSRLPGVAGLGPAPWSARTAIVPVHYRREVLGALLLTEPDTGLDAVDEDLLLSLAVTAGTAIENARLYEEARQRQEWLQAAAEVGNAMLALTSEREALALVAGSLAKLADAELVAVWAPDPTGEEMVGVLVEGEDGDTLLTTRISSEEAVLAEVVRTGRGLRLSAADRPDCSWLAAVAGTGIGTVLVLPLLGGSGARGVLVAGRRSDRLPCSALDLDMAETFAGQLGLALDRLSVRTTQQRLTLLEDRERIARDLHDHVIQSLFAAALKVQSVERSSQEPAVRPRLAEVVRDIDATIRRLRTTIFQLADASPAGPGLRRAVLEVVAALGPVLAFEPAVEFVGAVDAATDPALVEEVVAVLREAATNSGKHAHASRLLVRLEVSADTLTLLVEDDGVGIGRSERRSGLANLRRRAERLGGDLEVTVPAGGGTRLCWAVPLPG